MLQEAKVESAMLWESQLTAADVDKLERRSLAAGGGKQLQLKFICVFAYKINFHNFGNFKIGLLYSTRDRVTFCVPGPPSRWG